MARLETVHINTSKDLGKTFHRRSVNEPRQNNKKAPMEDSHKKGTLCSKVLLLLFFFWSRCNNGNFFIPFSPCHGSLFFCFHLFFGVSLMVTAQMLLKGIESNDLKVAGLSATPPLPVLYASPLAGNQKSPPKKSSPPLIVVLSAA